MEDKESTATLLFAWADLPGHISYVLIAVSYWLTSIYWLRITAVIGLLLEIVYFRMSSGALHVGIAWDVVFILINLYQIYRLVAERRALGSLRDVHLLQQGALADFDERQLVRLIRTGEWRTFQPGTRITEQGQPVSDLVLICTGRAAVEAGGELVAHLHGGAFVGEMAFLSGQAASATVTAEQPTRAFVFDHERLRRALARDDLVAIALHRAIGRDLVKKLSNQA